METDRSKYIAVLSTTEVQRVDKLGDNPEKDSEIQLDDAYERAKKRALAMLRHGFNMGGGPYPSREELHERRPENSTKVDPGAPNQDPEQ